MRRSPAYRLLHVAAIALLALSLGGWGFAHVRHAPQATPELAAFFEAGGSPADLCHSPVHETDPAFVDCPACRLVNAAAAPDAAPPGRARAAPIARGAPAPADPVYARSCAPTPPTRGPPAAS